MDDNENVETHDTDGGNDQEDENTHTRSSRSSQSSDHSSHSTQSTAQSTQSTPSQSVTAPRLNRDDYDDNRPAMASVVLMLTSKKELYYHYEVVDASVNARKILDPLGKSQTWMWTEKSQMWQHYLTAQRDECSQYSLCGAYGSCNINSSPVLAWI
ncbi:hypothetical protein POM88_026648 [Heracleum sosnowskyi]|uniref:S-locus glycoprotein domain-containing protein n=1 Tax=Heracleum sosnowskyi TaxID=360622 RepID=A0AAD8I7J1_9APIA|nr:hypothetical protein POM88_026648 [Heracleum sosnowskyi]